MKVDTEPEVNSAVALEKLKLFLRTPCILPRVRQRRGFLTNFKHFLRDGELGSWRSHFQRAAVMTFFQRLKEFGTIFRTPSRWT